MNNDVHVVIENHDEICEKNVRQLTFKNKKGGDVWWPFKQSFNPQHSVIVEPISTEVNADGTRTSYLILLDLRDTDKISHKVWAQGHPPNKYKTFECDFGDGACTNFNEWCTRCYGRPKTSDCLKDEFNMIRIPKKCVSEVIRVEYALFIKAPEDVDG